MPDRSVLEKQIAAKTGLCLLLGIIIWTGLLVQGSQTLANETANAHYNVKFGLLTLNVLAKHALENGSRVTFTFEGGIGWYLLFWLVLGIGSGLIFAHLQFVKQHNRQES